MAYAEEEPPYSYGANTAVKILMEDRRKSDVKEELYDGQHKIEMW